jgi:hypothetical protein
MSAFIAAPSGRFETPAPRQALQDGPPPASAPFAVREAWCQKYSFWVVSHLHYGVEASAEARPTQQFENEFNSCKLDPEEYERQTRVEASQAPAEK